MSLESKDQPPASRAQQESGAAPWPSVTGEAMQAGRVTVHEARLELRDGGERLFLIALEDGEQLFDCALDQARLEPQLGTAPRRLTLPGGHLFMTSDPDLASLLGEAPRRSALARLEGSWRWIAAAVLATLGAGWLLWSQGVPRAATLAADMTPAGWTQQMDASSLGVLGFQYTIDEQADTVDQARAKRVFRRLAAEVDAPVELRLMFVDMSAPNAFALPGGTLLVTEGLLEEFGQDEGALAAVLGHEIAHVTERHGLQNLYSSSAIYLLAALVFGDVGPVIETLLVEGQALLNLVYSREHEREADRLGLVLSRQAGYDPQGLIRFLQALKGEAGADAMPAWLSTHPGLDERIDWLQTQLEAGKF